MLEKSKQRFNIPSNVEFKNLRKRIKDLEELRVEKEAQMGKIKEERVDLCPDLKISLFDSIVEIVILKSVCNMRLGEEDIKRVK